MKKIKFYAVALAVLAMFSCSKENTNGTDNPTEGKATYANFSVQVKSPGTYAAVPADANGVVEEQTITKLKMFIFNGGVLETIGDITLNPDNVGTTTLKTTTGAKVIYAVANANDDMTMTVGQTLDKFKTLAVAALTADIAATGDFVMVGTINTTLTEQTEDQAKAAPIAINVARAAAKVQMKYDPATVKITEQLKGAFTLPVYQLMQMNTKMFLPRTAYELTPNGAKASQVDAATPADGTYDHLTAVTEGTYLTAAETWDFAFANSAYTAENVNEAPVTGNTTFTLVRLKYTPHADEIAGTNRNLVADGTFYVVINGATSTIYADKTEADAAQEAITAGAEAKVYTEGQCYYRMNLRDITKTASLQEKYCVLRNNFYKVNITEVNSIGGNSPTDPDVIVPVDPETPLETETHISADITIVPWTVVEMNEPLG